MTEEEDARARELADEFMPELETLSDTAFLVGAGGDVIEQAIDFAHRRRLEASLAMTYACETDNSFWQRFALIPACEFTRGIQR